MNTQHVINKCLGKNKEEPSRYRIVNGKKRSKCCDAPLISKGSGDSICSNCNTQITWGN